MVSFQEYDPDLPPELAAAAAIHDISSGNANLVKMDSGQSDVSKGSTRVRPPLVCRCKRKTYIRIYNVYSNNK